MHRSLTLILFLLAAPPVSAAEFCAFPGRDGDRSVQGVVNLWFASPARSELSPGSREIQVDQEVRGLGELQSGDLLLLVQMQGATLDPANTDSYGDGVGADGRGAGHLALEAGRFEFLRLEQASGNRLRVRGGGPNGGLVHRYVSSFPAGADDPGAVRWQLIRVPQFENLTLTGDLQALPWDGRSGGILAVDVRRELDLGGFRLDAGGMGFRGGAALTLVGALGDERDFVYRAPSRAELGAAYGQHGSKGEGVAGTPRWIAGDQHTPLDTLPQADRLSVSDGYPGGSMAKGAPGNAGGGGSSLSADNSEPAGGGGGGGGAAGSVGEDRMQALRGGHGGGAIDPALPLLIAGGGGGAGTRSAGVSSHGDGGRGGGVVLVRTGRIQGPGVLATPGRAGKAGDEAGGGGGGGGTLWLQAAFMEGDVELELAGGKGGKGAAAGGRGGAGRLLMGGGMKLTPPDQLPVNDTLDRTSAPGVTAGYLCRPAGMLLAGTVFEDNGLGEGVAHDGRRHRDERGLGGWSVTVTTPDGTPVVQTETAANGQFALELEEVWAGKPLRLQVKIDPQWHAVSARAQDLPLAPFRYSGAGRWHFTAQRDYLQDGLVLGLIQEPRIEVPELRNLERGSTQFFLFRYLPHTEGRARFRYRGETRAVGSWRHSFFLDPDCDGASEFVDRDVTRWVPLAVAEPVCVRVRVDVPRDADVRDSLALQVDVETDLGPTPLGLALKPVQARIVTRLK